MIANYTDQARKNKIVAYWLLIGVFMIIIQTLLGGITRLSGSGLSITEWNLVTGTLPPLNDKAWLEEFGKYQQSPQFKYLNQDFGLSDFKFIFFWEWFHRLWARILGFVFAIPFIYFLIKRYFTKDMVLPIFGMFALGALQGAIGWIMVASGLVGDAIYVRPTKLALHFIFAMILACYVLWFALKLLVPNTQKVVNPVLRKWSVVMLLLLFIQLTYGALMAGHKAATVAATWPTINGMWVPDGMSHSASGHYLLENKITIHFIHRGMAYLLFAFILIYTVKAAKVKPSKTFNKHKWMPLILGTVQVLLGIFTVLSSTGIQPNKWRMFETIAELHQLFAMFLMLSLVVQVYLVQARSSVR
ncbi:COX15/CtaA family protein [Taibaiella sp. KBW10]|uniref:COX15/CtaA family protein n=1 Tax=Taibaiella sp. KBW10 TaxID=2153357 RepID=UPI001F407868|nr:COX15/CtaA family protein [Taibaiella sp. KBW10]